MTCTPGTHFYTAGRCTFCAEPVAPRPRVYREPDCLHCRDTGIEAFLWVGPGPTLTDWRPVPCRVCQGSEP